MGRAVNTQKSQWLIFSKNLLKTTFILRKSKRRKKCTLTHRTNQRTSKTRYNKTREKRQITQNTTSFRERTCLLKKQCNKEEKRYQYLQLTKKRSNNFMPLGKLFFKKVKSNKFTFKQQKALPLKYSHQGNIMIYLKQK